MRHHRLTAAVVVVALLTGCAVGGGDDADAEQSAPQGRTIQPGAPGEESRELSAEEVADLALDAEPTEADVRFMQHMIAHHVQALQMTRLVPDRTSREDVPLFAERIDLSQEEEIDAMRMWLETHDQDVPSLLPGHDHGDGDAGHDDMPGMLTEDELLALEDAEGEEFDRLFLESMIYHHLGAIEMVQELFDAGGGVEPEIARFANHVVGDQQIEIDRAERMLADIG
jgi:uncharacterized protein (DUF305 family)